MKKNFEINAILATNLTFAFFPISFILGNFVTNLNLVIFCLLGIYHLKGKILKTNYNLPIKIIFLFFLIIFFSTALSFAQSLYLNGFDQYDLERLTKSILFLRFFLMLIIVYLLSAQDILNFKYFFITAALSPFVISLDVIFQYIFGFNIIGLKNDGWFNSSFFGDELIAGGFIQNFSFFSIIFAPLLLKEKNFINFIAIMFLIGILFMGIIFSGNRMPLISFLFGLLLAFIFTNYLKKIVPLSFILLLIIFQFITLKDQEIKNNYLSYFHHATNIIIGIKNITVANLTSIEKSETNEEKQKNIFLKDKFEPTKQKRLIDRSGHNRLFLTAIDTWRLNKIFGNGIKSFRKDCLKLQGPEYNFEKDIVDFKKNRLCSNHPHNYYLEILTELGIVGFLIVLLMATIFIKFIIKNFKFMVEKNFGSALLLASTISFILGAFPLKSTGSIFTTNNTTYLILISSIILSYKKVLSKKN